MDGGPAVRAFADIRCNTLLAGKFGDAADEAGTRLVMDRWRQPYDTAANTNRGQHSFLRRGTRDIEARWRVLFRGGTDVRDHHGSGRYDHWFARAFECTGKRIHRAPVRLYASSVGREIMDEGGVDDAVAGTSGGDKVVDVGKLASARLNTPFFKSAEASL